MGNANIKQAKYVIDHGEGYRVGDLVVYKPHYGVYFWNKNVQPVIYPNQNYVVVAQIIGRSYAPHDRFKLRIGHVRDDITYENIATKDEITPFNQYYYSKP